MNAQEAKHAIQLTCEETLDLLYDKELRNHELAEGIRAQAAGLNELADTIHDRPQETARGDAPMLWALLNRCKERETELLTRPPAYPYLEPNDAVFMISGQVKELKSVITILELTLGVYKTKEHINNQP